MIDARKAKELTNEVVAKNFIKIVNDIDERIAKAIEQGDYRISLFEDRYIDAYTLIKKRYKGLKYKVNYYYGSWEYRMNPKITISWN